MRVKELQSYRVHRWMHEKLHLKGVIENVFACIYECSAGGRGECTSSASEIAEMIGISTIAVYQRLKVLTEMEYVSKRTYYDPMPRCAYKVNLKLLREVGVE